MHFIVSIGSAQSNSYFVISRPKNLTAIYTNSSWCQHSSKGLPLFEVKVVTSIDVSIVVLVAEVIISAFVGRIGRTDLSVGGCGRRTLLIEQLLQRLQLMGQ